MALMLKCPKCKTTELYGGYPADPRLSTVLCRCGYAGPGATFKHYHTDDETCALNYRLTMPKKGA